MRNKAAAKERRCSVYIAGPLFSHGERTFNTTVDVLLEPYIDTYLPQRDGGLLADMIVQGTPPVDAAQTIFHLDLAALRRCDIFLIILDGRSIDEGAAFELGVAFALGKKCFGLQTDPRRLLPHGNNPMIDGALSQVFNSLESLRTWATTVRAP
jgi:nucleoside 2-deoxyribosyltransferase